MNGFYFLASRIISIPVTLIGISFGQVFYKEVTLRLNNKTPLMPLLINSIKKLLIISIPFFLLILFSHQNQLNYQKLIKISIIKIPNFFGQIPLAKKKIYQLIQNFLMTKISS